MTRLAQECAAKSFQHEVSEFGKLPSAFLLPFFLPGFNLYSSQTPLFVVVSVTL
jgi:hypothetical protein